MWCELDEEFGEQMNELIEKQHADWRPQSRLFGLLGHFSRLFWCYLGQICQIDIYGGLQSNEGTNNTWNWKHRENFDKRYATINRNRWWPYLAFTLYSYSAIRLLINSYFQYLFDCHFLRLQVFKALTTHDNVLDVSSQLRANANSPYIRLIMATVAAEQSTESGQDSLLNSSLREPKRYRRQVFGGGGGGGGGGGSIELAELSAQLNELVREARASLKFLGAPYINFHFVIELIYEFLYHSGFILVVVISVYYSYVEPFNFCLTRAFLDYKHERRLENKLVLDQINRFVASSRNFTEACVAQIRWHSSHRIWARSERRARDNNRLELNKFLLDHMAVQRQLKQMALDGVLLPAHRTAKWAEQLSILTVLLDLLCMFYGLLGTLFFAFFFFALNETIDIEISPLDMLVIAEAGVQVALIIFIGIFFITQIIANCLDQILFSLNIRRQIRNCIQLNQRKLQLIMELERGGPRERQHFRCQDGASADEVRVRRANLLPLNQSAACEFNWGPAEMEGSRRDRAMQMLDAAAPGAPPEHYGAQAPITRRNSPALALLADEWRRSTLRRSLLIRSYQTQMSSDLLKVLMQYKIFVAQIKPVLRSFGTFASAIFLLMVVVPLNVRLHSPYLDRTTKFYSMSFNLLCTTIVNLCYIPLCYLHSRCLDLYGCQSSLLAHAVQVASYGQQRLARSKGRGARAQRATATDAERLREAKLNEQTQIYESHSIWLLRKELNQPRQLLGQFAIYAFSVRLTYGNILRLHFWVGLITLSMVVDTASNHQDFFGRLFSDPLGVFNWQPATR